MAVVKDCLKDWHVMTRTTSEIKRDAGPCVAQTSSVKSLWMADVSLHAFGIEVTEHRDPEFVNRTLPNSRRDMGLGHATRSTTCDEDAGQEVIGDVRGGPLVGHLR